MVALREHLHMQKYPRLHSIWFVTWFQQAKSFQIQFTRFTKHAPPYGCACQLHSSWQNH